MLELKSLVRSRYNVHKLLLIELRWPDDYLPDLDGEYNAGLFEIGESRLESGLVRTSSADVQAEVRRLNGKQF